MGQVITVMNMKGGVGKTTVCMHIGGLLGRRKFGSDYRKVLLVDYDPQFNLSQALLSSTKYFQLEKENKTCLHILQDTDSDIDPFEIQTPSSVTPPAVAELAVPIAHTKTGVQIDLVPSTLDLMYIALGTSTGDISIIEARFKKFLVEARQNYDVVMIDCHPAGSILTKTSLQNSDHVIIPVAPERYAARGVALMMSFIESNRIVADSPKPHILFNRIPRSGPTPDVVRSIRGHKSYGPLCLNRTLKYYKVFSDPEEGRGFVWFSGKPYSTEAYSVLWYLVNEFVKRINL